MNSTSKIPWNRLAAEGFVVVVSILLAFAIDAWWDRYKEDRREDGQLAAMRAEFLSSSVAIDEVNVSVKAQADGVDELMSILRSAEAESVVDVRGCTKCHRTMRALTAGQHLSRALQYNVHLCFGKARARYLVQVSQIR